MRSFCLLCITHERCCRRRPSLPPPLPPPQQQLHQPLLFAIFRLKAEFTSRRWRLTLRPRLLSLSAPSLIFYSTNWQRDRTYPAWLVSPDVPLSSRVRHRRGRNGRQHHRCVLMLVVLARRGCAVVQSRYKPKYSTLRNMRPLANSSTRRRELMWSCRCYVFILLNGRMTNSRLAGIDLRARPTPGITYPVRYHGRSGCGQAGA